MSGFGASTSAALANDEALITPKVVGGDVARDDSWPSQAFVLIEVGSDTFLCGGTLIDPYWVLTAAHCVVAGGKVVSAGSVQTAIGIQDRREITSSDWMRVRSVSVHPEYQVLPSNELLWDFALLELDSASTRQTTDLIAPGQESLTADGRPGQIAGWGCTSPVSRGQETCPTSLPAQLREAGVSFIGDGTCASSYPGFDSEMMICAGDFDTGTPDTCFGDSGGPLTFESGGKRVLAGITSFGDGCAQPQFPGVYARVLAARNWILNTLAEKRTGPTVSLRARPAKRALRRKATFRFRASSSGSTFRCRLDGRAWRKCKSPKTFKYLKRGRKHTFRVKARKDGITGPVRKYTWFIKRR